VRLGQRAHRQVLDEVGHLDGRERLVASPTPKTRAAVVRAGPVGGEDGTPSMSMRCTRHSRPPALRPPADTPAAGHLGTCAPSPRGWAAGLAFPRERTPPPTTPPPWPLARPTT
jgi:hypothetical protein